MSNDTMDNHLDEDYMPSGSIDDSMSSMDNHTDESHYSPMVASGRKKGGRARGGGRGGRNQSGNSVQRNQRQANNSKLSLDGSINKSGEESNSLFESVQQGRSALQVF
jgi:hypothetical protein